MRRHLYFAAVALTLGVSAGASAQTSMRGGSGSSGGGSSFSGGSGGGGSSFSGGSGGGTSFSGGSGGGTSFSGGTSLSGGGGTSFSGGSGGTSFSGGSGGGGGSSFGGGGGAAGGGRGASGGSSFQVSQTNPFAKTYSNPLYSGRPGSTNISDKTAGGFGQPSFGAVTSAATQAGAGARGGLASVNNRGMSGGLGGQQNTPAVSYAATVRFPSVPVVAPALRANLQGIVSRSSFIGVPGNVRVETDGGTIVLRGKVADDDEKRLVESMVRLEPGVADVRNELEIGP